MLVGEAPGADEDRQGVPFVGCERSTVRPHVGSHWSRSHIGLHQQHPSLAPPGNRQPTPSEILACKPFVEKHIALISPKILVLVGGVAMKALFNTQEGIMRLRGAWQFYASPYLKEPIKAIATYHPSFLLRSPGQKAQSWQDMLMIKKTLEKE